MANTKAKTPSRAFCGAAKGDQAAMKGYYQASNWIEVGQTPGPRTPGESASTNRNGENHLPLSPRKQLSQPNGDQTPGSGGTGGDRRDRW
ncbi:MAG: hypothetical protein GY703_11125 [Gammaproteobacteria bacterium]|nr:hypothetical protein [Gammaproteobacteria bacterium]